MLTPINSNGVYHCPICNKKLQINAGDYFICPSHSNESFPKVTDEEAFKIHSRYQSYEASLCEYFLEHEDDIP